MSTLDSTKTPQNRSLYTETQIFLQLKAIFSYPTVLNYLLQEKRDLKLSSCWRQPVNASLPGEVKVTFVNYQHLSPYIMLPQPMPKNSLAVDGIELSKKYLL